MFRRTALVISLLAAANLAAAEKPLELADLGMQKPAGANAALQRDLEKRSAMLKWHQWVEISAAALYFTSASGRWSNLR
jgi:hypothetical protein